MGTSHSSWHYQARAAAATTKVLILFSDGRPQDRGIAVRGRRKNTPFTIRVMALLEARQVRHYTFFCLTVDKTGHDYMRAMCGDIGYEVLDDISLFRPLTHAVPHTHALKAAHSKAGTDIKRLLCHRQLDPSE